VDDLIVKGLAAGMHAKHVNDGVVGSTRLDDRLESRKCWWRDRLCRSAWHDLNADKSGRRCSRIAGTVVTVAPRCIGMLRRLGSCISELSDLRPGMLSERVAAELASEAVAGRGGSSRRMLLE
jgi:hypothetical protein